MKVLFLCRGNVARSVFGEYLYNEITKTQNTFSAGTRLSGEEQSLISLFPKTNFIIETLDAEGIDVRHHIRRTVTPIMVEDADIIIDMSEQDTTPEFVKEHPNRVVWNIKDPKGTSLEGHIRIKNEIKTNLKDFFGLK